MSFDTMSGAPVRHLDIRAPLPTRTPERGRAHASLCFEPKPSGKRAIPNHCSRIHDRVPNADALLAAQQRSHQRREEAFGHGIVIVIADRSHRGSAASFSAAGPVGHRGVLAALNAPAYFGLGSVKNPSRLGIATLTSMIASS